jgi:hypothetical protein
MAVYLHFVYTLYCLVFRHKKYYCAFVRFIQALRPVHPASYPGDTPDSFFRGKAVGV